MSEGHKDVDVAAVQPVETVPEPERAAADEAAAGPAAPTEHRHRPTSKAFRSFIASGWQDGQRPPPQPLPAAPFAAERRQRLSELFPGDRLVIPAGALRVRSNDTDFRFRPHSAFAHLTGLGTDREPDVVLVLEPQPGGGHEAVLFFKGRAGRDSEEFYASARYGELWVGPRPTVEEMAALTGLSVRELDELADALAKDAGPDGVAVRVVRGADEQVEALVAAAREQTGSEQTNQQTGSEQTGSEQTGSEQTGEQTGSEQTGSEQRLDADEELARALSELRLVKDAHEVEQLRLAVQATARGFEDIVAALARATGAPRGERVVESAFEGRARLEGNGVGYDTIAASGRHACTLHWIRNDGPVQSGDLLLVDAGVEVDSLYTADVTRTLPVDGTFTPAQRKVYQAVLDAADAAFAVVRPGARFREVHEAAMAVIAQRLHEWGMLPEGVDVAATLDPEGQFHRRWMVHGTSHHLGLDVHDCAQARREMYLDAELVPGMVFTIEPGLYFMPEDLLVPAELRGIGVRIEDDVLVTDDGWENLSGMLPRSPEQVERWMASLSPAAGG